MSKYFFNNSRLFCIPGRTEKIENNPDPSFKTKFAVNFSFEERQLLKFELYDWDKGEVSKAKLSDQDLLGSAECLLVAQITSGGAKEEKKDQKKDEKKEKKEKEKRKSKSLFHFFSKKKKSKSKSLSKFASLSILFVSVGFSLFFGLTNYCYFRHTHLHACKLS